MTALLLVSMPGAPLSAQRVPAPGSRVRFSTDSIDSGNWTTGRYLALNTDVLHMVATNGDTLRVPRPAIYRFELSEGQRAHTRNGLLIGALAGGLGAVAMRSIGCSSRANNYSLGTKLSCEDDGPLVAFGIGIAVGAPVGALIGRLAKTDQWVRLPVNRFPQEP